jgi:D-ribose pyranase
MIRTGILNPDIQSLLCRVRHTNTLVIADRGFPYFPQIETIDISLTDDIPTVLDVLRAISANFITSRVHMAQEFRTGNDGVVVAKYVAALSKEPEWEPHVEFKRRVPQAVGLIRTADTTQYANMILESA